MISENNLLRGAQQGRAVYDSIPAEPADDDIDADSSSSYVPPPPPPPSKNGGYSRGAISLDFERIVNEYSIQALRDRQRGGKFWDSPTPARARYRGHSGRNVIQWILTVVAGILTGLTTIVIVSLSEKLVSWRASRLSAMIADPQDPDVFVFFRFSFFSWILAFASSLLCVAWVPAAKGSGIPEVKAYLNGVRVERFSSPPLLFVKIVGTILSVVSSLAVGKEGPLVHIGAIVGASCSKLSVMLSQALLLLLSRSSRRSSIFPPRSRCCSSGGGDENVDDGDYDDSSLSRLWLWIASDLAYFVNDAEKRDLVSIGAAVGFAASFGAPIGGLLFILDDVSSFFSKTLFLRVLVANALGTFCLAVYRGDLSQYSVIDLGDYHESNQNIFVNRFEEIPFYLLTGAIGGFMGGAFSKVLEFRKRWSPPLDAGRFSQLLEVTILSVATSFLLFYATTFTWACRTINDKDRYLGHVGHQFFCEEGEVNSLATIFIGSRDEAIRWILTDPGQFQSVTLLTVGALFYFLTLCTFGTALPLGVFTPTVLIGASLGGAGGLLLQAHVDAEITPSTFALLGVGAMLAGVQRSTVSICVILVEGTGQIKVLIPVIITVVVARYVANLVHPDGIYEVSISLKGYPFLRHNEEDVVRLYDMLEVADVMSEPTTTVRPYETARDLVSLLESSSRNGFPVVDDGGALLGLVRRNQMVALLECGVFVDDDDDGANLDGSVPTSSSSSGGGSSSTAKTPSSPWTPKPDAFKSVKLYCT